MVTESRSIVVGGWDEKDALKKGFEGTYYGDGNDLYLDFGGDCTNTNIWQKTALI